MKSKNHLSNRELTNRVEQLEQQVNNLLRDCASKQEMINRLSVAKTESEMTGGKAIASLMRLSLQHQRPLEGDVQEIRCSVRITPEMFRMLNDPKQVCVEIGRMISYQLERHINQLYRGVFFQLNIGEPT